MESQIQMVFSAAQSGKLDEEGFHMRREQILEGRAGYLSLLSSLLLHFL